MNKIRRATPADSDRHRKEGMGAGALQEPGRFRSVLSAPPRASRNSLKGILYLLLASLAWGTTFVVQKTAMGHLGPFTYSGIRFLLGALFLLPLVIYRAANKSMHLPAGPPGAILGASLLTGVLVCVGINLQQIGLIASTAGKGGFITGLYVIIVPFLGIFAGQRTGAGGWIGAVLALCGLYLLSVTSGFVLAPGDGWILACAFVWALQVIALGWLAPKMDSLALAFGQSLVCGLLSLAVAAGMERISRGALQAAAFDLAYGGIVSVGLGFTLQVVGQKYAKAGHAAIIMQFEAVFALIAGWLVLGEVLPPRGLAGCGLMLAGMLVSGLCQDENRCRFAKKNSLHSSSLQPRKPGGQGST
jgi:drug/metabolite transporter (DMT)-like permease